LLYTVKTEKQEENVNSDVSLLYITVLST